MADAVMSCLAESFFGVSAADVSAEHATAALKRSANSKANGKAEKEREKESEEKEDTKDRDREQKERDRDQTATDADKENATANGRKRRTPQEAGSPPAKAGKTSTNSSPASARSALSLCQSDSRRWLGQLRAKTSRTR